MQYDPVVKCPDLLKNQIEHDQISAGQKKVAPYFGGSEYCLTINDFFPFESGVKIADIICVSRT